MAVTKVVILTGSQLLAVNAATMKLYAVKFPIATTFKLVQLKQALAQSLAALAEARAKAMADAAATTPPGDPAVTTAALMATPLGIVVPDFTLTAADFAGVVVDAQTLEPLLSLYTVA